MPKTIRAFACAALLLGTAGHALAKGKNTMDETHALKAKIARLAPVTVSADLTGLTQGDRQALDKIIAAARLLDPIYLRQVWSGNAALEKKLAADTTPLGKLRLTYFRLNAGPWSRLDKNEPFIAGVPHEKPPQGGFYPDDITREEFETWAKTLGDSDRAKATGFFTVVRRDSDRKLKLVPYHEAYGEYLQPAAKLLKEAAELTTNTTLKKYLKTRAEAFLSDDYYESDVAWMDLDAPLDITIGPYETYEDELFSYKASFEAFITLRDDAETGKLAKYSGHLQDIEDHLPLDPKYRNPKLGASAPIRVVDEVFTAGDARRGVATAAFNLPNDERVIKEKGSKRVMLKNVQEAKFHQVLEPIASHVLPADQIRLVQFEPFFTHILMHELMHGLGPQQITVGGRQTTVRQELKEQHAAIEEAKADITGLFAMQYLIDKGVLDRKLELTMYTTYLASSFRSVRFGTNEAHGKGTAMQFNYLTDKGAIHYDAASGKFRVVPSKIKDAVRDLTHDLLTLEAEGNYPGAKDMLARLGVVRPPMQKALDRLNAIPIDILPTFPVAKESSRGE